MLFPHFGKLEEKKTNRFYYNYCSPEAINAICNYFIRRNNIKDNSEPSFKRNLTYLTQNFLKINNKLKLGKVVAYSRFRPHMLRKFHASNLFENNHLDGNNQKIGLNMDQIDALQAELKEILARSILWIIQMFLKKLI